jgi:pimeloyl-ACP methyl ester carboxylesterase
MPVNTATYHSIPIDGVQIFFRKAGPVDAPVILLLHGFPSSSRMFAGLIELLADRYHLIAPDYPGFGSDAPDPQAFAYTFDHLAAVVEGLGTIWETRRAYWRDRGAYEEKLRAHLTSLEATKQRHLGTSSHPQRYYPDSWSDRLWPRRARSRNSYPRRRPFRHGRKTRGGCTSD